MQEKGLIIVGPSEQQSGAQELHVDWTSEQGRPKTRWRDHLTRQIRPLWSRLAKHRHLWDQLRVPFSRVNTNPDNDDDDERG